MRDSDVAGGVDGLYDYSYVLVTLEDVSGYTWLISVRSYAANFAAKQPVAWPAALRTPKVWVGDNRTHFLHRVIH